MPIQQWLYFDAVECLPANSLDQLTEDKCKPVCTTTLITVITIIIIIIMIMYYSHSDYETHCN